MLIFHYLLHNSKEKKNCIISNLKKKEKKMCSQTRYKLITQEREHHYWYKLTWRGPIPHTLIPLITNGRSKATRILA